MADLTLTRGLTTITLPEGLHWSDEFAWSPVGQVVSPSLNGALVIEEAAQQAGRPITLISQQDGERYYAPVARSVVLALNALAAIPGAVMTLVLDDGRTFSVAWRHDSGSAFTAEPWTAIAPVPVQSGDLYLVQLKLMQV